MTDPTCLWIVATPIGNLGDFSPRAIDILTSVAVIAAEDTRHTARLLAHAGIATPMRSLHEHNEQQRAAQLLELLATGQSVALVSDAGTPLISDPGFDLVRRARGQGVTVCSVPGPCAAIAALSIAGLPTDRFVFEGFLAHKASLRRRRLQALADEPRTLVLYESSHRIEATVADLAACFGPHRQVMLAREMTKLHEQSIRCAAGELLDWLRADGHHRRGEFVLVVAGADDHVAESAADIALDSLLAELLALTGTRDAVKAAVRLTGLPRNQVYARAVALQ